MSRQFSILEDICLNSARRIQHIPMLAARCEDTRFTGILKKQWEEYCGIHEEARKLLSWKGGGQPQDSEFSRVTAQAATNFRTLTDHSVSRLAELRIQDSSQGLTDVIRSLHQKQAPEAERQLAERLRSLEEAHIREMREYL
ncbi:MAG: hypothetical protein LUF34_09730 [Lachnospiraceae bacterium]|nr:hypothetical protein [Lachnospiraceae bacterium]